MRWLQIESVLKGVYLGLLLFIALQESSWQAVGLAALCSLGGLALALVTAAGLQRRQGVRAHGRPLAYVVFLLLESPVLVYAGVLLGTALAAYLVRRPEQDWLLGATAGGGAVLGLVFWLLRHVHQRGVRLGLSLLLGAGLVVGALFLLGEFGEVRREIVPSDWTLFGAQLLLGIPIFYLLTFAGREEESEVEIGVMCAALALGLGMLLRNYRNYQSTTFLAVLMVYFFYTTRVLPGLRVFKHALRGYSYARIGRHRQALLSFRRALQFDPNNTLAREGLWSVHRAMDMTQVVNDPQTLELIDFHLCVERISSLLLQAPTPEKLQEANRLLDLVESQRPALRPVVHYWRAVAHTHARLYDQAAAELERLLDPAAFSPDDAARRSVLLPAWQLGVVQHPELNRRVGTSQLPRPGRRLEAIGAVERQLTANPEDADAWALKRILYSNLTEAEYEAAAGAGVPADFDHGYAQQLGLALITDPVRWQRGAEYLRMAARGFPAMGPTLFTQIAQAHERAGDAAGTLANYDLAKRAGRAAGPKNLSAEDRQAYFAAVRLLGEAAQQGGDLRAAAENYELYTEYERSGVETLRLLADLYERQGYPLAALRATERGLLYNAKDKDLLERRERYYYSVLPDDLRAHADSVRSWFDVGYCLQKARSLLSVRDADLDLIEWAQHLADLALILQPDNLAGKVLAARCRLRRGERDEAVALLEAVRSPKPEKFASDDDEDAWFLASRLLGEMYLYELGKPDLAVQCFSDYRKCSKSGADTMYKLGQAYEQLGDFARAAKFYQHVTAYDGHPLAPDAQDALHRLQSS